MANSLRKRLQVALTLQISKSDEQRNDATVYPLFLTNT